jgi:hypothetical protein
MWGRALLPSGERSSPFCWQFPSGCGSQPSFARLTGKSARPTRELPNFVVCGATLRFIPHAFSRARGINQLRGAIESVEQFVAE